MREGTGNKRKQGIGGIPNKGDNRKRKEKPRESKEERVRETDRHTQVARKEAGEGAWQRKQKQEESEKIKSK